MPRIKKIGKSGIPIVPAHVPKSKLENSPVDPWQRIALPMPIPNGLRQLARGNRCVSFQLANGKIAAIGTFGIFWPHESLAGAHILDAREVWGKFLDWQRH